MRGRGVLRAVLAVLPAVPAALLVLAVPASAFDRGDDWEHAKSVVRRLASDPPDGPVVYLLGGSSARECTVDDAGWGAQIARKGVAGVSAFNLGSASQTYAQGLWLVQRAPDVPTLVLIGVSVGRYTPSYRAPRDGVAGAPGDRAAGARTGGRAYVQHRFRTARPLPEKRALVVKWLRERYPVFRARYADHAAVLPRLVAACTERGFRPVIVELPLDEKVVGVAWDAALHTYRRACREVAAEHHVPCVDFVSDIGLATADFHDLTHLIHSGRVKWQERLSRLVAGRLAQYELDFVAGSAGAP